MKDKIKYIWLPFVLLVVFSNLSLFVLNLIYEHFLENVSVNSQGVVFLIIVIAIFGIFGWFNIRLSLLKFRYSRAKEFYLYFVTISIALSVMLLHKYLEDENEKLNRLNDVTEYVEKEEERYFQIDSYYVDKYNFESHYEYSTSGSEDTICNMHMYLAFPVIKNIQTSNESQNKYWIGKHYRISTSENSSKKVKDSLYKKLVYNVVNWIYYESYVDSVKFNYLKYYDSEQEAMPYYDAISKYDSTNQYNHFLFEPVYNDFDQRNNGKLKFYSIILIVSGFLFLLLLITPKIITEKLEMFKRGEFTMLTEINEILDLTFPKSKHLITICLSVFNLIVFLIMMGNGLGLEPFVIDSSDLLHWGANYKPYTIYEGEFLRIIFSLLIHKSLFTLIINIIGLVIIGIQLEPILKKKRFLFGYCFLGMMAGVITIVWNENAVLQGPSGAIFGLY